MSATVPQGYDPTPRRDSREAFGRAWLDAGAESFIPPPHWPWARTMLVGIAVLWFGLLALVAT